MESTAAATVAVVMIQRAWIILRGIARGGNIVIMARMIMQIGMLVIMFLVHVHSPCVTWQACEDQQSDEQL